MALTATAVPLRFGQALDELWAIGRVTRAGWKDNGTYLVIVPGVTTATKQTREPFIGMFSPTGQMIPWLTCQSDVLANDWMVLG